GTLTGGLACYEVYHSQDGQALTLAALEPKFWANFCNAVNHPEWIAIHQDSNQQDHLKREIQAMFSTKSAAEWDALLTPVDCCFALVTPPANLIHDPHVQARQAAGLDAQGIPWMRSPVRFQGATV